jgi:hypothetical protein
VHGVLLALEVDSVQVRQYQQQQSSVVSFLRWTLKNYKAFINAVLYY